VSARSSTARGQWLRKADTRGIVPIRAVGFYAPVPHCLVQGDGGTLPVTGLEQKFRKALSCRVLLDSRQDGSSGALPPGRRSGEHAPDFRASVVHRVVCPHGDGVALFIRDEVGASRWRGAIAGPRITGAVKFRVRASRFDGRFAQQQQRIRSLRISFPYFEPQVASA
jgi:hypothetical protein